MPVAAGAVTFTRFIAQPNESAPQDVRRWLSRGFRRGAFEPIDRTTDADRSAGWVHVDDEEATDLTPSDIIRGEYAMASYRVDRLQIPARAVKAEVDAWVRQQESERGERPKRHEIREVKEMILGRLRERALVITRTYDVTWNLTSDVVQIWAGSKSVLEEVQVLMEDAFSIGLHTLDSAGIAARMGFDVEALVPTPELVKAKLTKGQVSSRVQS